MSGISTENLSQLPTPKDLQQLCKSISALEAIICPEWEYRYYSYQKDWSESEEFCEMRNGQGDKMLILFHPNGVCINGFAHESCMNGWKKTEAPSSYFKKLFSNKNKKTILTQEIYKGVVDTLPDIFHEFVFGEPVKSIGTTFCIWHRKSDPHWHIGDIQWPNDEYKDGSSDLLQLLDGKAITYKRWAESYYEEEFLEHSLQLDIIEKIYQGAAITKAMVEAIHPNLENYEQLKNDLDEIGYDYQF